MNNKKKPSGLAAKLIRETPRVYTGDINDKEALKAYRRGELAFDNKSVLKHDFAELYKEVSGKLADRKEKVAELEQERIEKMPVTDKIKSRINKFFRQKRRT